MGGKDLGKEIAEEHQKYLTTPTLEYIIHMMKPTTKSSQSQTADAIWIIFDITAQFYNFNPFQ